MTAASGPTLTATRGIGGTSGLTHAIGAEVRHAVYHQDFQDAADHIDATEAHGLTSDIVGVDDTQALTNKTMSGASNTFSNIPQSAVTGLVAGLAALDAADDVLTAADVDLAADISAETAARIAADALLQPTSAKGAASGYASLDGSTKVPFAQLPTGTGASEVAVGTHTHTASLASNDTSLTTRNFLDADPPKVLAATDSLAAGKYIILGGCRGFTLGSGGTEIRMTYYLESSAGTLYTSPVNGSSDVTGLNSGAHVVGYLSTGVAATVSLYAEKVNTGANADTSTTGFLVAVKVGDI